MRTSKTAHDTAQPPSWPLLRLSQHVSLPARLGRGPIPDAILQHPAKLAGQFRDALRLRGYSYRKEQAYIQCIRFVRFHKIRHPGVMGQREVEADLTHLASDQRRISRPA